MEPTIHGDPVHGDRVLVDKTAFWSEDPQAFELVVVKSQEAGKNHLVKRFIAQGPCRISLREGDLFVAESAGMQALVKDPRRHKDMRVTAFEYLAGQSADSEADWLHPDPGVWRGEAQGIRLQPAADPDAALQREAQRRRRSQRNPDDYLPGFLSLARSVDISFLNRQGQRMSGGSSFPRDIGLELKVLLDEDCRELILVLEHRGRYYPLSLSAEGGGSLEFPSGESLSFESPALAKGEELSLSFGFLDGHFFLVLGEEGMPLHHAYPLPTEFDPGDMVMPGEAHLANLLHLGSRGGAVLIRAMRVFHDVYYQPSPERIFELGPEEIFVLGDNSLQSSDSRDLVSTSAQQNFHFRRQDLIGRPIAVIGPWSAIRWLSP
jgi:hypothetical protein